MAKSLQSCLSSKPAKEIQNKLKLTAVKMDMATLGSELANAYAHRCAERNIKMEGD